MDRFADRREAGWRLAGRLSTMRPLAPVVLGIPRGGVIVAAEVASGLGAPLDVVVVRKLGVPMRPQLAMGAIGEGDVLVTEDRVVRSAGISQAAFDAVREAELERLGSLVRVLRDARAAEDLTGRLCILVDDGIATGSTSLAAIRVARSRGAARVVLAAPVIASSAIARLEAAADEVVWLVADEPFAGVGQFYENFDQVPDSDVVDCLRAASSRARTDVDDAV